MVIENYRSCLHTSIDLHPQLSVLIGPNGSGKTNILQGVMFLNKLSQEESFDRSFRGRGKDAAAIESRIKAVFEHKKTRVQLDAAIAASTDESNNDVILTTRQRWKVRQNKRTRTSFEMPLFLAQFAHHLDPRRSFVGHYAFTYRALRSSAAVPRWARTVMSRVANYCDRIRYYGASQFTNPSNCPASFQIEEEEGVSKRLRRVSRFRGHERILYGMYSAEKADESLKYQQFIDIVGPRGLKLIDDLSFREVKTSSTEYSVRVGGKIERRKKNSIIVIPEFRIGKEKLSPNQLSEGTFKTLSLLFHIITDDASALLIEEPEVCVHHGLLSSILELIKTSSLAKQIILSTHSDYVLDHVQPENVYLVRFDKAEGTQASNVPRAMTAREYAALREYLLREGNLGEYWREGGLGDRP